MEKTITLIIISLLIMVFSFAMFAGLVYVACWSFGWQFTWKLAIGMYAVVCILSIAFKNNSGR